MALWFAILHLRTSLFRSIEPVLSFFRCEAASKQPSVVTLFLISIQMASVSYAHPGFTRPTC